MKRVPFYANHEDDMHCMLAVYRSLFDYFLHRRMSWEELEAFTGFKPGRAAWTLKSLVQFAAMDFDIQMVEPFNYRKYAETGEDYLYEVFTRDKADWFIQNSNVLDIKSHIPQFLETISYDNRQATLQDIDAMLAEGRLVFLTVNSRLLNDQAGYVSHVLLVIDHTDDEFIVHDPGLPPLPNRHVSREKLWQAMGGDHNTAGVTGFKLKPRRNLRLDHYVIGEHPLLSRAYATRLIDDGKVLVNGKQSKPGYKVRARDDITIDYVASEALSVPVIDLPIIYEDDDCIVINKPLGVLSHSKGGFAPEATVASFLRSHLHGPKPPHTNYPDNGSVRAGIVHRLDRATSGIMICAKTPEALVWLQKQFHDRLAHKTYVAVVRGNLDPPKAIIDMPIERNPKAPATFRVGANGKSAVTAYNTLRSNSQYSLVELKPETGRTHQLRVHMAEQKHPIVGDTLYKGEPAPRLFLHAHSLQITLQDGDLKTFTAGMPQEFSDKVA